MSQPQSKKCPRCNTPTLLTAPTCQQCGHAYRTAFSPAGNPPQSGLAPVPPPQPTVYVQQPVQVVETRAHRDTESTLYGLVRGYVDGIWIGIACLVFGFILMVIGGLEVAGTGERSFGAIPLFFSLPAIAGIFLIAFSPIAPLYHALRRALREGGGLIGPCPHCQAEVKVLANKIVDLCPCCGMGVQARGTNFIAG